MKKILVLFMVILLSTSASAICLFGVGNCDKIVGVNPIFKDEEVGLLQEMSLREILEYKVSDIEREMPVSVIKIALPLSINVDEDFCVVVNKAGEVFVLDLCGNYDVVVSGGEEELKNLFLTETNQELVDKVIELEIKSVSFKGKLVTQIIENYFGIKFVKEKSVSQKIMSIVVVPVVGIVKVFS